MAEDSHVNSLGMLLLNYSINKFQMHMKYPACFKAQIAYRPSNVFFFVLVAVLAHVTSA